MEKEKEMYIEIKISSEEQDLVKKIHINQLEEEIEKIAQDLSEWLKE